VGTCHSLITSLGQILELSLSAEARERDLKPVYHIAEDKPITGLRLERFPGIFLLVCEGKWKMYLYAPCCVNGFVRACACGMVRMRV
jgi:hypothetical protein